MGPETTPERWYTRKQAAALTGLSVDTVERRQDAGELPNWRRRPGCRNGTVEYPLSDLIEAGLYTPPADGEEPEEAIRRVRDRERILELTAELADARARAEAHERTVEALTKQVDRLLKSVDRLSAVCAGGGR